MRRTRPHVPAQVAVLVAVLGCAAPACAGRGPAARTAPVPDGGRGLVATVTHVVDGDTIDVRLPAGAAERVRLLGIDTPETVKPDTPVQCGGPEASAHTKALLPPGTAVLLQRDVEARDRYGPLLAYVWRARDGRFVNRDLLTGGYARILSIRPNTTRAAELAAASSAARAAGRGVWGACPSSSGPGP